MKFNDKRILGKKPSLSESYIIALLERTPGGLSQKEIMEHEKNTFSKSTISESLKTLRDKDVVLKTGKGLYQYRFNNSFKFKNPDKVLNDIMLQLHYMPIDFDEYDGIDTVTLKDNWTLEQISKYRKEKLCLGITEDNALEWLKVHDEKLK